MRKNNIPFFEVENARYEIKRNRYLQAEFDALKHDIDMTEDEQVCYVKEQDFDARLKKLNERKNELYEKYLETFDEKDEELYLKSLSAYNKLVDEAKEMESVSGKQKKRMVDMGEKLIIKSLQINDKGENIRTEKESQNIWENFVEENGQLVAIEFIMFTLNYIMGGDEESENPFIAQAKAKAEQKASMKNGIAKAR